ncbi:sialic acid-binding Ig-like lectin 14 [Cavia porcellus]|uniref:sialic acid-binding Ig-like lectin 14 n=1 Tax=Cavia porcellus TaxID=10141 RepID=UPI002FE3D295
MSNGSSLTIIEGQFLNLVCVADSNPSPPASLSWLQKRKGLSSSQVSASGVLELSPVGSEDGGEFTCQVHHPLGSQCFSLHLFVQKCPSFYLCASEKQEGFCLVILPLVTVLAMGGSIVLTYVLTWAYYTSHGHEDPLDRCGDVPVFPGNCQITSTVTSRTGPCVPHPVLRQVPDFGDFSNCYPKVTC